LRRPLTLDQVLGKARKPVLSEGLAVLSQDQIRQLLTQPRLLLDLQEHVFLEGKDYWKQKVPVSPELRDAATRLQFRVLRRDPPAKCRSGYSTGPAVPGRLVHAIASTDRCCGSDCRCIGGLAARL
jgi:hypothetical protein